MANRIIGTTDRLVHGPIVGMNGMPRAIGADGIIIVVPIAVLPIPVGRHTTERMPPNRPILPIIGRIPANPIGSPKPIVDIRAIDVNRFDDIVGTIDVLVANHLHGDTLRVRVFLHIDGSDILEHIFRQHRLQDHQMTVGISRLDDTQIVHLPIAIQIEVGECGVRIVEHRLKLLQIFSLPKQRGHRLQVKIL